MSLLEEYPTNIKFLTHLHLEDFVLTIVSYDHLSIHIFRDESKVGLYHIPTKLSCILVEILKTGFEESCIKQLEELAEKLDILSAMFYAGGQLIGVYQEMIILFESVLIKDLLELKLKKEILCYSSKTICIKQLQRKLTYVGCICPTPFEPAIEIDRDLYVSLFGLEAYHRKMHILLFIFDDGQIRFATMDDFSSLYFLYSIEAPGQSVSYNVSHQVLEVFAANGKVFCFSSHVDTFTVSQRLEKITSTNVCINQSKDCIPNIHATGKCLLSKVFNKVDQTLESQLELLRKDLGDLQLKKAGLSAMVDQKDFVFEKSKRLTRISKPRTKCVESTYTAAHLKISLIEDIPFDTFSAICWEKRVSRTFSTLGRVLELPLTTLLNCKDISCCIQYQSEFISVGNVQFDIFMFTSDEAQMPLNVNFEHSCKFYFHESFVARNGAVGEYLLGVKLAKANCFKIAGCYARTRQFAQDDLHVFEIQCTSDNVLLQMHTSVLEKIFENLKTHSVPLPCGKNVVYA